MAPTPEQLVFIEPSSSSPPRTASRKRAQKIRHRLRRLVATLPSISKRLRQMRSRLQRSPFFVASSRLVVFNLRSQDTIKCLEKSTFSDGYISYFEQIGCIHICRNLPHPCHTEQLHT